MRRLLVLAVALSLPATLAAAQGLGEVAAKEKARREQLRKEQAKGREAEPKVFTNDDLGKGTPQLAQDVGSTTTLRPDERPRNYEQDSSSGGPRGRRPADEPGREAGAASADEASWRSDAREARKEVTRAEQELSKREQDVTRIAGEILRSTDTNAILRLRAEQQTASEAVAQAKQALEDAKKARTDLEDRARAAGVPPGWLREP